jgi:ABC-type branched-subunit amino acid transport system ATPase component/ABC-type branched-subunit amino acid transport system permease subunit
VRRLRWPGVTRAAVAFGGLAALPLVVGEHWILSLAIFTLMYAALGSAWNLLGGYAGYISLGHVAFFGIGAYALGIALGHVASPGVWLPFLLLPVIGVGTAAVTLPIAWVALRTRATTFAIVTLTLLFVVQTLAFNLPGLTGGSQGLAMPVPPFPLGSFERPFYLAMLALLALAMLVSWYVLGSRVGLELLAVREDEERARGLGVRTTTVKLAAFAASVAITAMCGGVWAYYIAFIYPQFAIDPLISIGTVLMVFLGGRGTLWGPPLGAAVLIPAQQYLAYRFGQNDLYLVGYAAVFLLVVLFLPRGILPSVAERARRWRAPPGEVSQESTTTRPRPGRWSELATLLEVDGVTKCFGGVVALERCSFTVAEGTITALIGPNGSGKTTVFNLVTGYQGADAGAFAFRGEPVPHPDPARLCRQGLARTFQQARVFPRLSVLDNLVLGLQRSRKGLLRRRLGDAEQARAGELLAEFGLTGAAGQSAGELSYGQRKLLELATVLMGRPRLVLLDEPTAGINPAMIPVIERHVRAHHARGVTFLIVEHDMGVVMRLCDPVIVLERGSVIATGPPAAVQADPRVLDAYLGA